MPLRSNRKGLKNIIKQQLAYYLKVNIKSDKNYNLNVLKMVEKLGMWWGTEPGKNLYCTYGTVNTSVCVQCKVGCYTKPTSLPPFHREKIKVTVLANVDRCIE